MRFVPSTRELSLTGRVVGEHYVTGFKDSFDTAARFNLPRRGHADKLLAPRRWMQIEDGTRRHATENRHRRRPRIGVKISWLPPNSSSIFSKVGFLVAAGIDPGDFHSALLIEVKFYIPSPRL